MTVSAGGRPVQQPLHRPGGDDAVRVDSGGTLNSVLLKAGVVEEVSVLLHPFLAGGKPDPTMFDPVKAGFPDLQVPLQLIRTEVVGDGLVWARYSVKQSP